MKNLESLLALEGGIELCLAAVGEAESLEKACETLKHYLGAQ